MRRARSRMIGRCGVTIHIFIIGCGSIISTRCPSRTRRSSCWRTLAFSSYSSPSGTVIRPHSPFLLSRVTTLVSALLGRRRARIPKLVAERRVLGAWFRSRHGRDSGSHGLGNGWVGHVIGSIGISRSIGSCSRSIRSQIGSARFGRCLLPRIVRRQMV